MYMPTARSGRVMQRCPGLILCVPPHTCSHVHPVGEVSRMFFAQSIARRPLAPCLQLTPVLLVWPVSPDLDGQRRGSSHTRMFGLPNQAPASTGRTTLRSHAYG